MKRTAAMAENTWTFITLGVLLAPVPPRNKSPAPAPCNYSSNSWYQAFNFSWASPSYSHSYSSALIATPYFSALIQTPATLRCSHSALFVTHTAMLLFPPLLLCSHTHSCSSALISTPAPLIVISLPCSYSHSYSSAFILTYTIACIFIAAPLLLFRLLLLWLYSHSFDLILSPPP